MLNAKKRAKWIGEIVSEIQRYDSKNEGQPEIKLMERALTYLGEARKLVVDLGEGKEDADDEMGR